MLQQSHGVPARAAESEIQQKRTWRNGRRKGLKIPWGRPRAGSSPAVRTSVFRTPVRKARNFRNDRQAHNVAQAELLHRHRPRSSTGTDSLENSTNRLGKARVRHHLKFISRTDRLNNLQLKLRDLPARLQIRPRCFQKKQKLPKKSSRPPHTRRLAAHFSVHRCKTKQ